MTSMFLRCRTAVRSLLAVSTLLPISGCVMPFESKDISVVAVDTETGLPVSGVRILRHVDEPMDVDQADE